MPTLYSLLLLTGSWGAMLSLEVSHVSNLMACFTGMSRPCCEPGATNEPSVSSRQIKATLDAPLHRHPLSHPSDACMHGKSMSMTTSCNTKLHRQSDACEDVLPPTTILDS